MPSLFYLYDDEIAAPMVDNPNTAILFNQPSLDKFEPVVTDGGTVLYDTSLGELDTPRPGNRYIGIPFTTIAIDLGSDRVANMVALGAYIGTTAGVVLDHAIEAMHHKFAGKEKLFPVNEKAISEGIDRARQAG